MSRGSLCVLGNLGCSVNNSRVNVVSSWSEMQKKELTKAVREPFSLRMQIRYPNTKSNYIPLTATIDRALPAIYGKQKMFVRDLIAS